MAVRFILGRSGTGKSRYCLGRIVRALRSGGDEPLVLLVPEQATYQAERAILTSGAIRAYSRLHVLSFNRLAFFLLKGRPARMELSAAARAMIVARLLRALTGRLEVFRDASRPGLAAHLAAIIEELQHETHEAGTLQRTAETLAKEGAAPTTCGKLRDLARLLEAYDTFMKGSRHGWVDPAGELTAAAARVKHAPFLQGARLWVDGFSGFTGQELATLAELLTVSTSAEIALCLDPDQIDLDEPAEPTGEVARLFAAGERTYARLLEIVRKRHLPLATPLVLRRARRFREAPGLARLEAQIPPDRASGPLRVNGAVELVKAHDARAEVRFVAERIIAMVREGRCRWRDVAVIVSDVEAYRHYLRAAFGDAGIPYFIDRPMPLAEHVLAQGMAMCLRLATGGWSTPEVLAYLKTPLSPLSAEQADAVEQYALAFGVRGEEWVQESPWGWARAEAAAFDEEHIDQWRRMALAPVRGLAEALAPPAATGEAFIAAIRRLFEALNVPRRIQEWCRAEPSEAETHRQAWEKFTGLCEEYAAILADQSMPPAEHAALLVQGVEALRLKRIPPTLDAVLVGSIERSRHPDLKVAFLVGATQRQFPVPVVPDRVLTDADREAAEAEGLTLTDRMTRRLLDRAYLAYIAFTRPSHKLIITWPCMDEAGRAVAVSPFVRELTERFEDLHETTARQTHDLEATTHPSELAERLCLALGADGHVDPARRRRAMVLLETMTTHGEAVFEQAARVVRRGVLYRNTAELPPDLAQRIYAGPLACSVSRLGRFAACPYQHFARHVLRLEPRRVLTFEPVDLGRFYHQVLDRLFRWLRAAKPPRTLADLEPEGEAVAQLVDELIAGRIDEDGALSSLSARSPRAVFMLDRARDVLVDLVRRLIVMSRAGRFRQAASEWWFGEPSDQGPGAEPSAGPRVHLRGGDVEVHLHGRIDRVDVAKAAEGSDAAGAIVFDYKRRDTRFSWTQFAAGLDLQLAGYLVALRSGAGPVSGCRAVGAFFLPIEPSGTQSLKDEPGGRVNRPKAAGVFNGDWAEQIDAECAKGRSAYYNFYVKDDEPYGDWSRSGALRPREFARLLDLAEAKIIELARGIIGGCIEPRPYRLGTQTACSRCDYAAVCKFDWQINAYRVLSSQDKRAVIGPEDRDG